MGLLDVADLQAGPLTPEQALTQAEALVASTICPGLPGLDERTWELSVRLRDSPRAFGVPGFGQRRLGPDLLRYWPITGLISVVQDGVDLTSSCTFDTFSIRRDALAPEFGLLGALVVQFKTGWTADTLPDAVKQAVVLTANALLEAPPVGVKAERIEEHSITYDTEGRAGLPLVVKALLHPYQVLL